MKIEKEYDNWRDIPILEEEDGDTILYDVYDGEKACGSFKILALGIAQVIRTCEMWHWDVKKFSIKRKSNGELLWSGLEHGASGEVAS
jgi:hypothetical protein